MEIKPRVQSADTSRVSQETSNEQSSSSSTPARVNFGVGKTQDCMEAAKAMQKDDLGLIFQGPLIGTLIGKAIGDSANDGDEDTAQKSGENERRSNSITSKD